MNEETPRVAPRGAPAVDAGGSAAETDGRVRRRRGGGKRMTQRSERVAERMGGLASTFALASLLLNFVLALAVFYMAQEPPAVFLLGETDGKFYQARGPVEDAKVMRTLMEKFARRYVLARETVNLVDDKERFEWVKANSTNEVWKVFDAAMTKGDYYRAAVRNHTTWAVKIVAAWQSNEANDAVWSLEIEKQHFAVNRIKGAAESWIVELKLARDGRPKTPEENIDNPAALYVLKYSAKAKEDVVKG